MIPLSPNSKRKRNPCFDEPAESWGALEGHLDLTEADRCDDPPDVWGVIVDPDQLVERLAVEEGEPGEPAGERLGGEPVDKGVVGAAKHTHDRPLVRVPVDAVDDLEPFLPELEHPWNERRGLLKVTHDADRRVAGRVPEQGHAGLLGSEVARVGKHADVGIGRGDLAQDRQGPILGTVVSEDMLVVVSISETRRDPTDLLVASADALLFVVDGGDD